MNIQEKYNQYKAHASKIADLSYTLALMGWDKEVNMPKKGAEKRAQQIGTLSGIAHELAIQEDFGQLLADLDANKDQLTFVQQKNVFETLENYNKSKKYTTEFVIKQSQVVAEAFSAWIKAREAQDFTLYQDKLQQIIDLKREEAEILGYEDHPYDAMLDLYEPNSKTKDLEVLFADVKAQLVDLVQKIAAKPQIEDKFMFQNFPDAKQWDFGKEVLAKIGYNFDAGRQDRAIHPFCTNFNANDVRLTTRVDENNFMYMLWSTIHEGGHGLYEQGLPIEQYGLPASRAISLGIHESQSRLYENNLGRSMDFWKHFFPILQERFPTQLENVSVEEFYKAMNKVKPSLVRTESDELTYHFHVLIRFEIEKGLMDGSILVKDLAKIWNAKYKEYLNIDVPNDTVGVLQDIHWSHGSIGYFPTYSLGSFYAAQFYNKAMNEIPNAKKQVQQGDFSGILNWLRENVHRHGKTYRADELCKKITGESLDFKYFMDYATQKYSAIYDL